MFEYFPGNYVWNLGVVAALNSGGLIDEVDRACRLFRDIATRGEDMGTREFLAAWTGPADSLVGQTDEAVRAGRTRTAGQTYARATNYLVNAERMRAVERLTTYRRCLDLLERSFELVDPATSRVSVPIEGATLPGTSPGPPLLTDPRCPSSSCRTAWTAPRSTRTCPTSRRNSPPAASRPWRSTAPEAAKPCGWAV